MQSNMPPFLVLLLLLLATYVSSNQIPLVAQQPAPAQVPIAPAQFKHPGVFLDKAQLDFIKGKVNAGQEPWTTAFNSMMASEFSNINRNPTPTSIVECGPTSNPNHGCTNERQDALSAYTMALMYYITNQSKYAEKAISYMNAWARTITKHTNDNAPLQTGWSAASWARAGEIIRYTYTGWKAADVTAFEKMLRNVYLPVVINGSQRAGNWDLVMIESAIGIAVFLNDKTSYDKAMKIFMGRVPAYIYLTKDGSYPKAAPGSGLNTKAKVVSFWYGQPTYNVNGIAQETCRDFIHTGYGLSSISHVAETSRIQGTDLFKTDIGERLRWGLGFHSQYQVGAATKPSWLCPGKSLTLNMEAITEVGFNALHTRMGIAMTNTQALTLRNRPAGTNWLFVAWETLTHAENTAGYNFTEFIYD